MAVPQSHELENLSNTIIQFFRNARILEANHLLIQLEEEIFGSLSHNKQTDILNILRQDYFSKLILYNTIKSETLEVKKLLDLFSSESSDWQRVIEQDNGTKVYWRPSKDLPIHTVRLDGTIHSSVFNILAVLLEVDLYNLWVPSMMGMGLKFVNMISDIDRFRKLVSVGIGLPWPISNRDAIIYGYGVDLLDQGQVLAVVRSFECAPEVPESFDRSLYTEAQVSPGADSAAEIPNDPDSNTLLCQTFNELPGKIPNSSSGYVRASVMDSGFLLTPVSEGETKVSFLFKFDPKLSVVPTSLVNWGLKHMAFAMFDLLTSTCKKVGEPKSPHTQRMDEKPEVYDYLRARLKENNELSDEQRQDRYNQSMSLLRPPVEIKVSASSGPSGED